MTTIKSKKYDYTGKWGLDGVIYRPIIEVDVSNGSNKISFLALIDSGTDGTILNLEIAHALGIDISKCEETKVGGIGEMEGFISTVTLAVPDFNVLMEDITVTFIKNLPFDVLLGQRDFFNKFKITFEKKKNRFELVKVA